MIKALLARPSQSENVQIRVFVRDIAAQCQESCTIKNRVVLTECSEVVALGHFLNSTFHNRFLKHFP